jgi:hypothetical protein
MMNELEKTITVNLELSHFKVSGIALVVDWYFEKCYIDFTPFIVEMHECDTNDELNERIVERINDGHFGTQKIIGAACDIEAVYIDSYSGATLTRHVKTEVYDKDEKLTDEERANLIEYMLKNFI